MESASARASTPLRLYQPTSPTYPFLGLTALALGLAFMLGMLIGRGWGIIGMAFAAAPLLLLLSEFRISRVLGFVAFAMLLPPHSLPKVSPDSLLILGEIGLAAGVIALARNQSPDVRTLWFAAGFVIVMTSAAVRGNAAGDTLQSPVLGLLTVSAGVFLVAAGCCRSSTDDEVVEFATLACIPGLLLGIWGIAEFALDRGLVHAFPSGGRRAVGPIGNPNYFGGILAQLAVLSLSLAWIRKKSGKSAAVATVTAVVCSLGVMATFSKAAIVALALGFAVALWAGSSPRRRRRILAGALIIVAAAGPLAWREITTQRLRVAYQGRAEASAFEETNLRARYLAARTGIELIMEHPWTGVGLERFGILAAQDPRLGIYINTHNEPIRIAAEAGLPALALMSVLAWLATARIRRRSQAVRAIAMPVMASYLALSLFMNGLESMAVTYVVVVCMFLAAGTSEGDLVPSPTARLDEGERPSLPVSRRGTRPA